jgi:hypothetical protein
MLESHGHNLEEPSTSTRTRAGKKNPTPFAWTKPTAAISELNRRMLARISRAVR